MRGLNKQTAQAREGGSHTIRPTSLRPRCTSSPARHQAGTDPRGCGIALRRCRASRRRESPISPCNALPDAICASRYLGGLVQAKILNYKAFYPCRARRLEPRRAALGWCAPNASSSCAARGQRRATPEIAWLSLTAPAPVRKESDGKGSAMAYPGRSQ